MTCKRPVAFRILRLTVLLAIALAWLGALAAEPPRLERPASFAPASSRADTPSSDRKLVYFSDFGDTPGEEWSKTQTAITPTGRKFLGHFAGEVVKLSLKKLPSHTYLRLSFDLFAIKTWDGSSPIWGSSTWALNIVGGPVLLYTSFGNCGFFTDNNEQAFPDSFPSAIHPAWTGADEKQTLGYVCSWGGPDRTFKCDAVYKFDLAFPHDGNTVTLQFAAFKGEPLKNESWGLANVRVEALTEAPGKNLSAKEMDALWDDLAGEDPMRAFRATWAFVAAGEKAVAFVREKIVPAKADAAETKRLIRDLDDPAWKVRDAATERLRKLGVSAAVELREAIVEVKSEEARNRLLDLIAAIPDAPVHLKGDTPEHRENLRLDRALQAMEVIATPKAMEIMKTFDRAPRRFENLKNDRAAKAQH